MLLGSQFSSTASLSTTAISPISAGTVFPLTVTVSGGFIAPTGTVEFQVDGTVTAAFGQPSGGPWSFNVSGLSQGSHSLAAIYLGDASNKTANSNTLMITVVANNQTISFHVPSSVPVSNGSVSLNATASSGGGLAAYVSQYDLLSAGSSWQRHGESIVGVGQMLDHGYPGTGFGSYGCAMKPVTVTFRDPACRSRISAIRPRTKRPPSSCWLPTLVITSGCTSVPFDYCPGPADTAQRDGGVYYSQHFYGTNNFTLTTTPYFTDVPARRCAVLRYIQKMRDTAASRTERLRPYLRAERYSAHAARWRCLTLSGCGIGTGVPFTYSTRALFPHRCSRRMHAVLLIHPEDEGCWHYQRRIRDDLWSERRGDPRPNGALRDARRLQSLLLACRVLIGAVYAGDGQCAGKTLTVAVTSVNTSFASENHDGERGDWYYWLQDVNVEEIGDRHLSFN